MLSGARRQGGCPAAAAAAAAESDTDILAIIYPPLK